MADTAAKGKTRQEIQASIDATKEETPNLWVWRHVGQELIGTVENCAMIPTEFKGEVQKDAKGSPKQHLRVLVRNDEGLNVLDLNSENAKRAYKDALSVVGYSGLAYADKISMKYTHNEAPLSDTVTGARAFEMTIS